MNDRLLHPTQMFPAFSAYEPDRKAQLELQIKQWLADNSARQLQRAEITPTSSRTGSAYRPREPVEEAISWAIVPNTGRKIPGTGQ